MATTRTSAAIEAVWRIEAPRLIGALVRLVRDVELAEDMAQEALVAALERWPADGVPDNPGAWLMTTARRRALDVMRRAATAARHAPASEAPEDMEQGLIEALDDEVGDDVLRLMLIACHPVLPVEGRIALTLRLLGGLSTEEIGRALLQPTPTIAQRIVRAKRALREAGGPFEVPRGAALVERLAPIFEVITLIFNEGYSATRGDDWMRPELCEDAMRLGRTLVALVPAEPEAHGLLALMELQASRTRARVNARGEPILLADQDRARWDYLLIGRGLSGLGRAQYLSAGSPGPYTLQAALAACHAVARRAEDTDWSQIVALYDALLRLRPSPVIALNRAVALSRAEGPGAALECVDALAGEPALRGYHLLHCVRADLLDRLGRRAEAADALRRALELTQNGRERAMLQERLALLEQRPS